MHPKLIKAFKSIDINDYVVEYPISDDYVSYRFAPDPYGASKLASRYNPDGINCFYIADNIETAQNEIHFNFNNKELYHVKSGPIFAFDAQKFATQFSLSPLLTSAEQDGGYKFCQDIASYLVDSKGLSGIAYPSRQMALQGKTGFCIALLPHTSQLESGKLEIFKKRIC